MTKACASLTLVLTAIFMMTLSGCSGKSFMGGIEVQNRSVKGSPTGNAHTIYVADFAPPANLKLDPTASGLQGMINQENRGAIGPGGGILSRLRQRSQPTVHGTPEEQSAQIVNGLAEDLTGSLRDKGFDAQRWHGQPEDLPKSGWLVKGEFNVVDEGNRFERAEIGFGQGATQMDVAVHVFDLAGKDPGTAFADFDTAKNPGMKPGGAVTMNPYAAAAKFHMEKMRQPRTSSKRDRKSPKKLQSSASLEAENRAS